MIGILKKLKKSFQIKQCCYRCGGSIGSELVFQIINNYPKKIILIDNNEFNLYSIEKINQLKLDVDIEIFYNLTSNNDLNIIKKLFIDFKPEIVFHKLYKHVPLAENNIIGYMFNNV